MAKKVVAKKVWESKTLWGLLVAGGVWLAAYNGYDLPYVSDQLVQLAGLVFAAYGRFVATKPLEV